MWLHDNDALVSLSGIDNIDPTSIASLSITSSNALGICEVKSICDYLAIPTNPASISGNARGCNTRGEVDVACEATVGINDLGRIGILMYPNPTSEIIEIKGITQGHYRIMTLQGMIKIEKEFSQSEINLSELPNGIYFIQIHAKDRWISKKIIKK